MASGFEEQPVIQGLRGERGNVRMPLASRTDFSVDWARGAISQWPAHHLRIRDAERRQRYARRGEGARAPAQRPAGEDQSRSLQSLAGQRLRMFGLGDDRELF